MVAGWTRQIARVTSMPMVKGRDEFGNSFLWMLAERILTANLLADVEITSSGAL
jgi:hypothetical protein